MSLYFKSDMFNNAIKCVTFTICFEFSANSPAQIIYNNRYFSVLSTKLTPILLAHTTKM